MKTKYFLGSPTTPKQTILLKWIYYDNLLIDAYWKTNKGWYQYAKKKVCMMPENMREITEEEAFRFMLENE